MGTDEWLGQQLVIKEFRDGIEEAPRQDRLTMYYELESFKPLVDAINHSVREVTTTTRVVVDGRIKHVKSTDYEAVVEDSTPGTTAASAVASAVFGEPYVQVKQEPQEEQQAAPGVADTAM